MRLWELAKARRRREGGQTLLMFVFFLVVLIAFVGLGVDLGFAYITKAQLSKGVDAAALAGMLNFSQGTLTAQSIAQSAFAANYQQSGRDVGPVTPSITFSNDPVNGNNYINVGASSKVNTFFIRVLPSIGGDNWNTLTVGANAQATRSKLIITLVLDRSGSMNPTNPPGTTFGGSYLPGAVADFVGFFDEAQDRMAVVSFASTATTNLNMTALGQPFKAAVSNAANAITYYGGTFSPGGLALAVGITSNAIATVPVGQNVNSAVVFFTDGLANMIEQALPCGNSFVFGGFDIGPNCPAPGCGAAFFDPAAPLGQAGQQDNDACTVNENGSPSCCSGTSQFFSQSSNSKVNFTTGNITTESQYECIQYAEQLRAQGVYVFSIGLATDVNDLPSKSFLEQVANDPGSPTVPNPSYKPKEPVGLSLLVNNNADLSSAFRLIAEQILLRLTQ